MLSFKKITFRSDTRAKRKKIGSTDKERSMSLCYKFILIMYMVVVDLAPSFLSISET